MTEVPDRVTADLRVHEAEVDRREAYADANRAEAREKLKDRLRTLNRDSSKMREPDITWVMEQICEDLAHALDKDYQLFLAAMAADSVSELGLLMSQAVDRTIDRICDSKSGSDLIDDILDDMEEDEPNQAADRAMEDRP